MFALSAAFGVKQGSTVNPPGLLYELCPPLGDNANVCRTVPDSWCIELILHRHSPPNRRAPAAKLAVYRLVSSRQEED